MSTHHTWRRHPKPSSRGHLAAPVPAMRRKRRAAQPLAAGLRLLLAVTDRAR